MVARLLVTRAATAVCCCCRRGSACRYDCLCFLVIIISLFCIKCCTETDPLRLQVPTFMLLQMNEKQRSKCKYVWAANKKAWYHSRHMKKSATSDLACMYIVQTFFNFLVFPATSSWRLVYFSSMSNRSCCIPQWQRTDIYYAIIGLGAQAGLFSLVPCQLYAHERRRRSDAIYGQLDTLQVTAT